MTKSLSEKINKLPKTPGVYFFKNKKQEIIYIGKAKNIRSRVKGHFINFKANQKNDGERTTIIPYRKIIDVDFIPTRSEKNALILESGLVKKHQPKYNIELKDDKNFIHIGFSNDTYPKIFTTRQPKKIKAQYIGPFVAGFETKKFLEIVRKLFPYRTCNNSVDKPCLYFHLGLCSAHKEKSKDYQKVVNGLKAMINIYNGRGSHIECYDISNTSGKLSVGSMITFKNNRPEKSLYRKFKIKTVSGSNDPASLKEIIDRRLSHKEWRYPDLIVVDGGRGQLSKLKNVPIPIIGIAKRAIGKRTKSSGTLFSPYGYGTVKIYQLPQTVRDTILKARDEAHRFAIKYHRNRRIKNYGLNR